MITNNFELLNDSWEYHQGDIGGIWESLRPVKPGDPEDALLWEKVSLPHCFNAFDSVTPDKPYYQGPGWYRKEINPDNPFLRGRTFLYFEGAGQSSEVYVGDRKAGEHKGGYDEWSVDITDFIESEQDTSGDIRVSIRCSNSRDLETIPSDLSDFNLYGGLYRSVKLIYQSHIFLQSLKIDSEVNLKSGSAELNVKAELNQSIVDVRGEIEVFTPHGERLFKESFVFENGKFQLNKTITEPVLWSPDQPELYNCQILLLNEIPSQSQIFTQTFGIRYFKFEKHGPFFLNGERVLLKGTHRHEDHAGVAGAMTAEVIEQEMRMIKDMGANFIRLGHYQQSKVVLDLCDSLGILVWEEIPWCRGGVGNREYKELGKDMLRNMIDQHYNHPSIIIWGLGNENDWPGDFFHFNEQEIRDYMIELNEISHELDRERKTAIRRCDFCKDIPDVYSPSIWAGWYRGHYSEYKQATLDHIGEVDHFLHVEWGASSHAGRFTEDTYKGLEMLKTGVGTDERGSDATLYGGISRVSKDGNWSENYACDLFDWTLKEQESMTQLTGTAFWPFKDFATPLRAENPVPYVNQKGVVERDLSPKEAYYVTQSFWAKEPMLRIFGHKWAIRWGAEGEKKEFRVYSNCSSVELFLNGKSLGIRNRDSQNFPAAGLRWEAELFAGEYSLEALSLDGSLRDNIEFKYVNQLWKEPNVLIATSRREDGERACITVEVHDDKGRICLDCEDFIHFSIAGKGRLLSNLGTVGGSSKVQLCNGTASIFVEAAESTSVLSAHTETLSSVFVSL